MANRVWKEVFGQSCQVSQIKFFDPRSCSMRNDFDEEEEKKKREK